MVIYQLAATLNYIHYDLLKSASDLFAFSSVSKDEELRKDADLLKIYSSETSEEVKTQYGVIHRDITPTNIMIKKFKDHGIEIRVIDWGFRKTTLTEENVNTLTCGTENYQAPEFD